jgi:hypothetical protein
MPITRSWRTAAAVVSSAALLAVGADSISYAAAGHSVLLGKSNSAGNTTTIKNTGRGPALALDSGKRVPSLKVSSRKLVKNLNAEMLGGKGSKELAPTTTKLKTGAPGAMPVPNLYEVNVPTGDYLVSMFGLYSSTDPNPFLACTLFDKDRLEVNDISGPTSTTCPRAPPTTV